MISGIVLAAGAGSRFGRPKALVEIGGIRLVDRAVAALRDGGCDEVIAVVRAGVDVLEAKVVVNPDPGRGLSSTLVLGLGAATGDRAVILPVDVPGVGADAVAAVLGSGADVAVATYAGRRGHPVLLARRHWPEVISLADGDTGARPFLRARADLVVEVPCPGDPSDIDTPDDLQRWLRQR